MTKVHRTLILGSNYNSSVILCLEKNILFLWRFQLEPESVWGNISEFISIKIEGTCKLGDISTSNLTFEYFEVASSLELGSDWTTPYSSGWPSEKHGDPLCKLIVKELQYQVNYFTDK